MKLVSTRKIDELVQPMWLEGMDESLGSRLCQDAITQVETIVAVIGIRVLAGYELVPGAARG